MGRLRDICARLRYSERSRAVSSFVVIVFAAFVLLTCVLLAMPVREAVADTNDYGPDGYFSALNDGDMPMRSFASLSNARVLLFGKSGTLANPQAAGGGSADVSGEYFVLGKGPNTNTLNRNPTGICTDCVLASQTTTLVKDEVLLWASHTQTSGFTVEGVDGTATYDSGVRSDDGVASYESKLAKVSRQLDSTIRYSPSELAQLGAGVTSDGISRLNAVCTSSMLCAAGSSSAQSLSVGTYRVFGLSMGDTSWYFSEENGFFLDDEKLRQCGGTGDCRNHNVATWTRTSRWDGALPDFPNLFVNSLGNYSQAVSGIQGGIGLRPALRLRLDNLLLSALYTDQSQQIPTTGSMRLTFVEPGTRLLLTKTPYLKESAGEWVLTDLTGTSDLSGRTGFGWKLVDPQDSKKVVASGRTNKDADTSTAGNMVVPCAALTKNKDYVLSVWGQRDGGANQGHSNFATEPVTGTVQVSGDGTCSLDIKNPPSYGIDLTGKTTGTLKAYRIGEYADVSFDQTGALKDVRVTTLSTPTGMRTMLKDAAVAAGGTGVDDANPIGWVAANWLGYPTDPLSQDVTSARSPYAGKLQLFAKELAKQTDAALGGVQGSLVGLSGGPVTLPLLKSGLYLIKDSRQSTDGSLPIIVGTKALNEGLGNAGDSAAYVDFADAGVNGKPRLGQAALKTTVTDVAKFVVNDPGLDGFDVGSRVDFEVQVPVPSSLPDGVSFDEYVFDVSDSPDSSLKFDVSRGVSVLLDTQDVSSELVGDITFTEDSLKVSEVGKVFAEGGSSQVVLRAGMSGKTVLIRYSAMLQADALLSKPADVKTNANTVTLTRTKSTVLPDGWTLDGDAGTEWKQASAKVYSFRVDVVKADKDALSTKLAGAEFEVSRDEQTLKFVKLAGEGEYRLATQGETGVTTVSTGAGGKLSLQGVEARELSFKETVAPSGYFKVSDFAIGTVPTWNEDVSAVTAVSYESSGSNLANVSEDGGHVVVLDPAWSLANLPYTGGIGILILLVVGALILVFAVRPYVLSKRAERDANLI
jgi:fimbrial isopeptide formation D2 family protein